MKKQRGKTLGPGWLRWLLFSAGAMAMGLAAAVAVQWVVTGSLSTVWAWFVKYPGYLPMNALLYGILVYVLGAALGRLWLSGAIVGALSLILALVDYFKTAINGTPLELADFGLATQLGQVAGVAGSLRPPEDFWRAAIALSLCCLGLFLFRRLTVIRGRTRYLSFSLSLVAAVALCSGGGAVPVANAFGVDVYTRLDAASSHDTYGLGLSLWRSCFLQSKTAPEGYSREGMEEVLRRIDELLAERRQPETEGESPNVIFVLSESFYDVGTLPDITFGSDPLANFHALQAESISGDFHSHYLGYGTGYIEMSMLSGLRSTDLGPGTNICFLEDDTYQRFDSLAEQFTADGTYRAEMLHAYNDSLYNRTVTYPLLGFSDLYFSQDIQSFGLPWKGSVYGGYYLKDSYLFRGMERRMETVNGAGERAFLYGISMENHQPFRPDKFDGQCRIELSSDVISPEDMEIVKVMVEGIARADEALGMLAEELRQSPEPTVLVFFGDHRPNLFLTDGGTVYTHLGLCPENDTVNWTAEQVGELYSTSYLIWANDAALLRGQAGTEKDSSVTAIGPQVLELLNRRCSRYWGLLSLCSEVCLTETDRYFVDGSGTAYASRADAPLTAEARELLTLREAVIYDAVYGRQYITRQMNECP